jgi:hypothetical protein
MNDMQKRFLLFLFGCIPTRSLFVFLAKKANPSVLMMLGYLALIPAIGLMYIYLTGSRNTGAEVFGSPIWWNDLRPIHSLLYFMFAISAIYKKPNSWMYLLVDVIFGLFAFLWFHYSNGDFKFLFK